MDILKIKGGKPLEGHVKAAGAKNAVTKLLVASLLSDKRCVFFNVPNILDVEITVDLCREIGSIVHWDQKEGVIEIVTKHLKTTYIPQRFSGSNRIPILMIGALLGRTDEDIIVPTAGGCKIGPRPVDFHIAAFEKLGATIEFRDMKKEGAYLARAHHGLKGTLIELPYPSVGATENTILAACRAKGTTVIKNAAIEPEIIDLVLFLQKLGVAIVVDVDRTIRIQAASEFFEVEHTVVTDRIEAASLGMAAISTKGKVFVEGAQHGNMIAFLNKLREIGAGFNVRNNGIEFFYRGPLKGGILLETDVHPGFLTDWQQPFVALLTQAEGHSIVHETVYENRFGYTETLREMGADIQLFTHCLGSVPCRFKSHNYHHSIVIKGPTPLISKDITIPDLRAGFAYVLAALMAPDTSNISGAHFLDRGYEHLVEKLASLGAEITRETVSNKKLIGAL
ncbi:MAG: UDP-N-acetylglucosamine 1-carboxyvinyltransferase [Rhabdochlamydiaceae bacterium]|nr:UDP-N-acetylglucosamine 1-carboxyvinyltransferase [Rhabdochlamydiaceae bacterium]